MFNLATFLINKNNSLKVLVSCLSVVTLLLTGCAAEFPGGSENQDGELTLASRIEHESNFVRVNNLAQVAVWDAEDRRLQINGFSGRGSVGISNAATGQFIGTAALANGGDDHDDDDDRRAPAGLVLQNVTAVPCSVRVQVGRQVQNIPVLNAPRNCVGIASTSQTLHVDKAKWKVSSNKLSVKGGGAAPRQLVSIFDGITGQLLGTDQASSVGNWKIKIRNMVSAPCSVSVVSAGQTVRASVQNAPLSCSLATGTTPGFPGNNNLFNQAPEGVIVGPIADMAINVGGTVNFMGTGFDPDSALPLTYRWNFDGAAADSMQQNQSVVFTQPGVYVVSLTVTDSMGLADASPATRTIVVQPAVGISQAPSGQIISPPTNVEINAGSYVNFMGSGFDPDGLPVNYVWNFAGGVPTNPNAVGTANPGNVLFSTPGVYLVSLTVIDATNVADPTPEYRAITVKGGNTGNPNNSPNNQAPNGEITSPASNVSINVGSSINFTATAFDPDSTGAMTYRWDFAGVAPVSNQLNPGMVTFNRAGIYTVTFTATDALGRSDLTPSTRIITVGNGNGTGTNPNNFPPESTITFPTSNQTISVGQSINFMGSGYDADNNVPLSYRWDFMGAAPNSTLQNPGPVVFSQAGTYNVTLTVTDSLGNVDITPAVRTITVVAGNGGGGTSGIVNQAPESNITLPVSDQVISVGQSIEFAGTGTDPENNSPLIYAWDFDNAAPNALVQNPGRITFNTPGSYRVRLTVRDANGNVDLTPAVRIITVTSGVTNNLPPNGFITSPANSININVGGSVNFAGSATDPEGNSTFTYEWDFGGVAPNSSSQNPGAVIFNQAGIYKVTLYVKDVLGLLDPTPEVRFITVQNTGNTNQPPVAKIISPATDVTINLNDSIVFSGIGEDPDNFGSNLTYNWNFGGAAANSSLASPGAITFTQPGVYNVSLNVMDNFGQSDTTPATRKITVVNNSVNNRAPIVNINSPASFSNISVNSALNFSATATDLDNEAVTYYWNFDGAAPDSTLQTVNNVVFSQPGTYKVSVVAIDARMKRSNPATVTVVVNGNLPVSTNVPNGVIVTPANDMTINVGGTVDFMGSVSSNISNTGLRYRWNFDGAATSSTAQNPGNVTFNKVGVYRVSLTVADNTGATDASPAIRTITVRAGANNGFPGSGNGTGNNTFAPNGIINSPTSAVTNIQVGGSVNFSASGTSSNNLPLSYRWTFGNGMLDQFVQSPGQVVFSAPGTYNVTLTVTDSMGVSDPTPDVRTIIVGNGTGTGNNNGGVNVPINGVINSPASSVTISKGQSVYFNGSVESTSGTVSNVTYNWDFAGGATNSTLKTPGNVVFNIPGLYVVKLTVRDSQGNTDLTPATQVVIVLP